MRGSSLGVQWLGLHAFTAEGLGSIPGQGTKILQATLCNQKKEKRKKRMRDWNQMFPLIGPILEYDL